MNMHYFYCFKLVRFAKHFHHKELKPLMRFLDSDWPGWIPGGRLETTACFFFFLSFQDHQIVNEWIISGMEKKENLLISVPLNG